MPRQTAADVERTRHVMASYEDLSTADKERIMALDKRLERKKLRGMGRILRLEVLWAIGKWEPKQ